jgi:hypothetical protein
MNQTPSYNPRVLRPYRRFPALYAELKYPHISSPIPPTPFRLFDLPGEIRMRIYEVTLTLPFPIELWPETDDPIASHQSTACSRNMKWLWAKLKQRGVNLKILRVCKLIREEATRVWYESNEWRFSGVNGWMIANAFLYTTILSSSLRWQHIRCITLPLPFDFMTVVAPPQVAKPAIAKRAVLRLAKQISFAIPPDWSYEDSVADVCLTLRKCDRLKEINLLLPGWYDTGAVVQAEKQGMLQRIEILRVREVKVRLVKLSSVKMTATETAVVEERQKGFVDECRARGWEVGNARCDKFGGYEIV